MFGNSLRRSLGFSNRVSAILLAVSVCALTGCSGSSGPTMGNVSGKVLFSDGSIPAGGVIRFEPVAGSSAELAKAASSYIEEDGSYSLYTVRPDDGVILGNYKVVFTIEGSYREGGSLVDAKYTAAATTPFERVVDSSSHTFDFEVEKADAKQ